MKELQRSFRASERSDHYLEKESLTLEQHFAASQSVFAGKKCFIREQKKQQTKTGI